MRGAGDEGTTAVVARCAFVGESASVPSAGEIPI
jgi:hypothetical protein